MRGKCRGVRFTKPALSGGPAENGNRMDEMKKIKPVSFLAILGTALILAGLIGLYGGAGTEISQYAFAPGEGDPKKILESALQSWEDAYTAVCLHGISPGAVLSTAEKSRSDVALYETDAGYHTVYPREFTAGRPISAADVETGSRVIVLDDDTAFQLFGGEDPIGRKVLIGQTAFETVGVAKLARGVGDVNAYRAWIPLGLQDAPACEILVLSAAGPGGGSMKTLFENGAKEAAGEGQSFFLGRERTRGWMILRLAALVAGWRLLAAWLRFSGRKTRAWIGQIRERSLSCYPERMIFYTAGRLLGIAGLYAAAVAAGVALALLVSQPMTVFPEWVPEVLVDPASIAKRFWELVSAAAQPRRWQTPEMAEIRFWSALIRWGTVLALLGVVPLGKKRRSAVPEESGGK